MTVLLDSSVIIDALCHRRGRQEFLTSLAVAGHQLVCCAVNIAEVYSGMRPEERSQTVEFFDKVGYVGIDRDTARNAGELREKWRRKGRTLSLPDAIIGAVALAQNLTLATDNLKDFPMAELKFLQLPKA